MRENARRDAERLAQQDSREAYAGASEYGDYGASTGADCAFGHDPRFQQKDIIINDNDLPF
jgi:hypothetical protein